jgi:FixJ family two-component response regulator
MSEPPQTVFIVDDDPSFLASMSRWLDAFGYSVESYSSAMEFLAQRPKQAKGCVITDLRMPGMGGTELQHALERSGNPLPIIFLTGYGDIPASVQAMRSGAEDFLVKTADKETILDAVERALARDSSERLQRRKQKALQQRFEQLTPRQYEVLTHVLLGKLNKLIAADLGIDERSVKRHRANMMKKLQVNSVAELARLAIEAGVVSETEEPGNVGDDASPSA